MLGGLHGALQLEEGCARVVCAESVQSCGYTCFRPGIDHILTPHYCAATNFAQLMQEKAIHVVLDIRFEEHKFAEADRAAKLRLIRVTFVRVVLFLGYGKSACAHTKVRTYTFAFECRS